jgi:hypothetical protein
VLQLRGECDLPLMHAQLSTGGVFEVESAGPAPSRATHRTRNRDRTQRARRGLVAHSCSPQVVRVAKTGYASRLSFVQFAQRFFPLHAAAYADAIECGSTAEPPEMAQRQTNWQAVVHAFFKKVEPFVAQPPSARRGCFHAHFDWPMCGWWAHAD